MKYSLSHQAVGLLLALTFAAKAFAQDLRDQTSLVTGKAELVFAGADPHEVAARVKDAISQFAIPGNLNFRSLPTEVSPWPDQPSIKQVFFRGAPLVEYHCPTAYAEVTKNPPPVNNPFMFVVEWTQFCFYSFERGVKAYVLFSRAKRTEALTSGLFGGIANAIQGTDDERISKQLQETIDNVRKAYPAVLVSRVEVPGKPLQEPDKTTVATLIPAKPSASQVPVPAVHQNAVSVQPVQHPVSAPQQVKIEARKNLTAMGMTYHSADHFLAAIRRKDELAVQLFLDAEGVELQERGANGLTPLELAKQVGATAVVQLIQAKANPGPSTPMLPPAAAATPVPGSPVAAEVSLDIPKELLASIDEALDAKGLSPELRAVARANMIRQLQEMKQAVDRLPRN